MEQINLNIDDEILNSKILGFKDEMNYLNLLMNEVLVLRKSYLSVKNNNNLIPPKDIPFIQLKKCVDLLLSLLAQKPPVIDHKQAFLILWQQVQHYREQAELFHKTQEGNTGQKIKVKSSSLAGTFLF